MARTCEGSRSFSIRLNSAALAGSGEASLSMTATRPPGAQTRVISESTAAGSRKWWKAKREMTSENAPSGNGRGRTSPSFQLTLVRLCSAASARAGSIMAGVRSMPVACLTTLASAHTTMPPPHATSRAVSPGPAPVNSTISRSACLSLMPGEVENGTAWRLNWSRMRSRWLGLGTVPSGARPLFLGGAGDRGDLVGEVDLAVVFRRVADLLARVDDTPEAVRVAADAVDDQEGHPVLVGDVLGLDHANRLLDLVPLGEIGAEAPVHHLDVARLDLPEIGVVARAADAPLDDLVLAAVHLAGGEDEAQELVRGLGPPVPVVRPVRHVGRHHLHLARPDEPLVIVGGVVGAAHDHTPDALLERRAVHVVGERDVLVLGPE